MDSHIAKSEILAVDDEPSMLELLVDILSLEGFQVRSTACGELALQSVASHPPDLILLDINMPGIDGIEVCRRLKAQEETRNIPIIFISGTAKRSEMAEGFALGAVDFIPKPYQIDELLARVRNHLELSRVRADLEARVAKRTEELCKSEAYFRELNQIHQRILSSTGEGIYGVNTEGQITFVNPAALRMLQYENIELIGQNAHDLFHHTTVDEIKLKREDCAVYKSFREGITSSGSADYWRKDGTPIPIEFTSQPILENGQIIGAVVSFKDITERMQSLKNLRKGLEATIQAIAVTVETRDPYTAGHQRRTADLARSIATEMNLSADQIDGIRMATTIHDLGKISVPSEILSKPSKLTALEFSLVKSHSQSGYDILKSIDFPWPIARIILEHHERLNGLGYPNGLTGDKLLIESKILTVADVVESMASHRPYRPALGLDVALDEIIRNKDVLYDGDVVDACLRLFREKNYKLMD